MRGRKPTAAAPRPPGATWRCHVDDCTAWGRVEAADFATAEPEATREFYVHYMADHYEPHPQERTA